MRRSVRPLLTSCRAACPSLLAISARSTAKAGGAAFGRNISAGCTRHAGYGVEFGLKAAAFARAARALSLAALVRVVCARVRTIRDHRLRFAQAHAAHNSQDCSNLVWQARKTGRRPRRHNSRSQRHTTIRFVASPESHHRDRSCLRDNETGIL